MRASHAEQTGSAGLHEVEAAFERLGWGPEAVTLHDLGTDLWVQVRDEDRRDLGRLLGVQVRSGSSYFKEAVESDGEIQGWIFRESDEHMRYWLGHSIPHVVVLHDPETSAAYWVHITKDTAQRTGEGWKALVPRRQTLTPACREALVSVAYCTPISFEGSAWPATRPVIEQRRLWRHALLAPRLVAPHRNATPTSPITPVEGAAMVVLSHTRDLDEFGKKGLAPSIDAMRDHPVWGWRFVAALLDGGVDAIAPLTDLADSFEGRVAATVAASCAFAYQEDHGKALSLLRECLGKDLAAADRAWLLLHQARFLAETGETLLARDAALEASKALAGEPTDITVSAMVASASWILWRTSDWIARDLGAVLSAGDTAASWWQGQTLAGGLADFLRDSFEAWAETSGIRFRAEDATLDSIDRAVRQSDYAADQGTLAHSMCLKGMYRAMGASDDTVISDALGLLRRSGDSKLVEHAVKRIWAAGPLEGLRSAAQGIGLQSWTHSTGETNLVLWRHAGDVMTEETATSALGFCLEALQDPDHEFYSRTTPQFLTSTYLRRALAGLLRPATTRAHTNVAATLAQLVLQG
ncbi:MAG: DUF4365 domain-containing protein, partial [Armatimonadetes bacterium]|nr:DUF4365 domain-containing protein [Armatimonadota bacterium]